MKLRVGKIPTATTGSPPPIAGESVFHSTLGLERRRSERTGQRIGLILVDLGQFPQLDKVRDHTAIGVAIRDVMRETDCTGWYRSDVTVGIILTTINGTSRADLERVILEKIRKALSPLLGRRMPEALRIECHVFPEDEGRARANGREGELFYAVEGSRSQRRRLFLFVKRAIDLCGSLTALILLSPVFLAVAILVRATSAGPVFYRQTRVGQHGKEFTCLKFRSMHTDSDPTIHRNFVRSLIESGGEIREGGSYKIKNDPRVTRFGRVLRRSSLDELPQLINVLKGEMSLVGPRPPIPYELDNYALWHRRRTFAAKPGLTGEWQVNGRSRTTFDDMVRMDLSYVENQSLWLDMKILLKTPLAVLSGNGAD